MSKKESNFSDAEYRHLQIPAVKAEYLGQEEVKSRPAGFFSSTKATVKERINVYSIGERAQVLVAPEPGIVVTHIAEVTKQHYPYEVLFKSFNRLLLDNASSEYIFVSEFFQSPRLRQAQAKSANGAVVAAMTFVGVFGSTLEMMLVGVSIALVVLAALNNSPGVCSTIRREYPRCHRSFARHPVESTASIDHAETPSSVPRKLFQCGQHAALAAISIYNGTSRRKRAQSIGLSDVRKQQGSASSFCR